MRCWAEGRSIPGSDTRANADCQGDPLASLALEFTTTATPGPAQEELLEVFLVGGQARFEAVSRSLVTFAGPQPTEAATTRTRGTFTDHGAVDHVEMIAVQHGLAAGLLQLLVAAVMLQAAPVSGIHGGAFAPQPTVAAISVI